MYSLLIDVVSNNSMILVWSQKNNKLVGKSIFSTEKNSSEVIISKIEALLNKYYIDYNQIEKIVAVIGPGNYTNIRVGISAAKGIGIALDINILAAPSVSDIPLLNIKNSIPQLGFAKAYSVPSFCLYPNLILHKLADSRISPISILNIVNTNSRFELVDSNWINSKPVR